MTTKNGPPNPQSSPRVAGRSLVTAPSRTIQVERVRVSEEQQSSVAIAIRLGRQTAGKSR